MSSCGEDIAYQIEGKLDHVEEGQVLYAVFENDETKAIDTVTCGKKGEFVIKLKRVILMRWQFSLRTGHVGLRPIWKRGKRSHSQVMRFILLWFV